VRRLPLLALWTVAAFLMGAGALAASLESPATDSIAVTSDGGSGVDTPPGQEVGQINLREQGEGGLDTPLLPRLRSLLGMILLGALAWAFSVDRSNVAWRVILWGIGLQLIFAFFILKTPMGAGMF
jgi:hypothetical protein